MKTVEEEQIDEKTDELTDDEKNKTKNRQAYPDMERETDGQTHAQKQQAGHNSEVQMAPV